ncbi:MAG: hypothetical protein V2I33_25800 [Kangiellaceae bacterium]|jgi:hypothetical protein|nr:hypothetical protein [Kangiellaceae bacterium]
MNHGVYFGDIEVIQQIPRLYAAAGSGYAEILVMTRALVTYIADEFFSVYEEMYNVAEIKKRNYELA